MFFFLLFYPDKMETQRMDSIGFASVASHLLFLLARMSSESARDERELVLCLVAGVGGIGVFFYLFSYHPWVPTIIILVNSIHSFYLSLDFSEFWNTNNNNKKNKNKSVDDVDDEDVDDTDEDENKNGKRRRRRRRFVSGSSGSSSSRSSSTRSASTASSTSTSNTNRWTGWDLEELSKREVGVKDVMEMFDVGRSLSAKTYGWGEENLVFTIVVYVIRVTICGFSLVVCMTSSREFCNRFLDSHGIAVPIVMIVKITALTQKVRVISSQINDINDKKAKDNKKGLPCKPTLKRITYNEADFGGAAAAAADAADAKKRPRIRARAKCLQQKIQLARDRKSSNNNQLKRTPLLAITNGDIPAIEYPAKPGDLRNNALVKTSTSEVRCRHCDQLEDESTTFVTCAKCLRNATKRSEDMMTYNSNSNSNSSSGVMMTYCSRKCCKADWLMRHKAEHGSDAQGRRTSSTSSTSSSSFTDESVE